MSSPPPASTRATDHGALPLHHTYGMGCCLMTAIASGATLLLPEGREPFLLRRRPTLELIEQERVTVLPAVPNMLRFLARAPFPRTSPACVSAFRGPPPAAVDLDEFKDAFEVEIRQLYGCTETGTITMNLDDDPEGTSASVGRRIQEFASGSSTTAASRSRPPIARSPSQARR